MTALTRLARRLAQRWPGVLAAAGSTVLACAPAPTSTSTPAHSTLAFTHVTVVDVTDGTLHPQQTVVIAGTRIRALGPTARVPVPAGTHVVDASGQYLIPGLWDMHTHVYCYPEIAYPLFITNGVTGIRDLNQPSLDSAVRWRREVAAGTRVGPRLVLSGPALDGTETSMCGGHDHIAVATPARAQLVVDSLKAAGADVLKVYEPSREVYFAIAAAARRAGTPFGGHLTVSLFEAADSGQRIIDHTPVSPYCMGDSAMLERCTALAAQLRRRGTWLANYIGGIRPSRLAPCTYRARMRYWPDSLTHDLWVRDSVKPLGAWEDRNRASAAATRGRPAFQLIQRAGIPLLAGTDVEPGEIFALLRGYQAAGFALSDAVIAAVERLGQPPLEALQAATWNPARALGATDSLGTVAAGKLADLVLLAGNPLADIYAIQQIRAVVANGRYFDRTALDALLAERAAHGAPQWAEAGCTLPTDSVPAR